MFGSKANFEKLVDKATSQLNLDPDWDSILQVCDTIRKNEITPKQALTSIKKRISSDNPRVAMYALQVLESAVKNCGANFHQEVANKDFMEFLKTQIRNRPEVIRNKLLELIQVWSHAFRNDSELKAVQDTFHVLKIEGYNFPEFSESDAMFRSEVPPEWKDGESCFRCRTPFSLTVRKHHCRHCGQVFCSKCSSKLCPIPKFGFEKDVRVCETCHDTLTKGSSSKFSDNSSELPAEYLSSALFKESQKPQIDQKAIDRVFDEETQLAIALSKSLEESAAKLNVTIPNNSTTQQKFPQVETNEMDPELRRYLDTEYWKEKAKNNAALESKGSNNVVNGDSQVPALAPSTSQPSAPEVTLTGATSEEEEEFLKALRRSVEIFVNRMKSDAARGRSIAHDSSVQTLFSTIAAMHPRLMALMAEQEERRAYMESLQDRLMQMKDAREALDGLREEEREKRRKAAEEAQKQRQLAMNAKLAEYRARKFNYLEVQRQQLHQRMLEQERELAMRIQQHREIQQVRNMQWIPGAPVPTGVPQNIGPGGFPMQPNIRPNAQNVSQAQMMPSNNQMYTTDPQIIQNQAPPVNNQYPPPGAAVPVTMAPTMETSPLHQSRFSQMPQNMIPPGGMAPPPGQFVTQMGVDPNQLYQFQQQQQQQPQPPQQQQVPPQHPQQVPNPINQMGPGTAPPQQDNHQLISFD